jgi:chromosome segregation ATPase
MTAVLSKEAELKDEVASLKAKLSGAEQQNIVLSKQAGNALGEVEKLSAVASELEQAKIDLKQKDSEIGQLKAAVTGLTAQAAEAEAVLGVAKSLKSLLAKV